MTKRASNKLVAPLNELTKRALVVLALVAPTVAAQEPTASQPVNKDAEAVAIKGYDAVAYFTVGQPMRGKPEFEHVWQDATWRFSSADHRDRFAREPNRFAPRYGGFCAGAMALGWKAPVNPEAWVIVDGNLYLNYSKRGRDSFARDPAPKVTKADHNWQSLGKLSERR